MRENYMNGNNTRHGHDADDNDDNNNTVCFSRIWSCEWSIDRQVGPGIIFMSSKYRPTHS